MKTAIIFLFCFAYFHPAASFLTAKDLSRNGLKRCYERGTLPQKINGQDLPLPSSMETFVSLVERIETKYPTMQAVELIKKLQMSFRVDDLTEDFRAWSSAAQYANDFEKLFFNIPSELKGYEFAEEDFTEDEQCALHFMLSHTINATAWGTEELKEDGTAKHPRELGVVSLHSKWKHALSLNKVLLGILAGMSGPYKKSANEVYKLLLPGKSEESLNAIEINRLYAVTLGDLVSHYVNKIYKRNEQIAFVPNGVWNDLSCPTSYALIENNGKSVTNSVLRGAIDGLIIGLKIEENLDTFQKLKLSQILSMYYGPTGLITKTESLSKSDLQWCEREKNFNNIQSLKDEIYRFYLLYTNYMGAMPTQNAQDEVSEIVGSIQKSTDIFNDITAEASTECMRSDTTLDKRCSTPYDMFAILDWGTDQQRNFQLEVIGNLSVNFDVGPRRSSFGVYSNMKSPLSRGLNTIVNNTGVAGCQSCYPKYYQRSGGKNSDIEVIQKLNETLADFVEEQDQNLNDMGEVKSGTPAKIILYFSYNTAVNDDYRLRDALWEFEKSFKEATILAVGPGKESLKIFTLKDDFDVFQIPTGSVNAADLIGKLKNRICKVPAEFQFKECQRNSRSAEAENRQELVIGHNRKQYWAMYPKYFLKSFSITLKFKPLDGAQIKVCFTRSAYVMMEDNPQNIECHESSGEEIKFFVKNPCYKRNVNNCDPFFFTVEGKRPPNGVCQSLKCVTPRDIQFEFQHEGISCNAASFISVSMMALVLAALAFFTRMP
ncbi:uncharacterized protein LOC129963038 [Argiope bruennichi]|uniref:uncharacterized protein LOC129963038 n=1 Tax=Argiope bruennichi TaxID=94029 RepID=UPI002494F7A9|nr:uncharacterized protein LOC129963038 [Argiope bruennichi]